MATVLVPDDIDFGFYLQQTESDHRVRPASEYAEDVIAYFHGGGAEKGALLPWRKAEGKIRFRPNEVTVWGGFNGHGKSLVLGQVMMHFMRRRERVCIASMEMKPAMTMQRMCRQAAGKVPDPDYIREFHNRTDGLLWLYDQQGTINGEKVAAVIRYAVDKFHITHFVADSLLKFGYAEDDYTGQKHFVDLLCSIARDTGVHIHLVHHSRKGKDEYAIPNKHDMKGSGSIIDQVDNLVIVWKNKKKEEEIQAGNLANAKDPDAVLVVEKQRNGEWEGKMNFWFDPNGRMLVESQTYGF